MSWHREATKDAVACDKPAEAGKRAVIPGFPNDETRLDDLQPPAGRLESAQLALGSEQEDATQLAERRKRLADAYLERSRAALAQGDVNGATTALTRARSLMPRAPGVAADVSGLQKPAAPAAPAAQPTCTP